MRSKIILTVEHGEDTDSIQEFMETVSQDRDGEAFGFDFKVVDTEVEVDVPN